MQRLDGVHPEYLAPVRDVHRSRRGHVVSTWRCHAVVPPVVLVEDPRRRRRGVVPRIFERQGQSANMAVVVVPGDPAPASDRYSDAVAVRGCAWMPLAERGILAVADFVRRGPDIVFAELQCVGGGLAVAVAVGSQQAFAPVACGRFATLGHGGTTT